MVMNKKWVFFQAFLLTVVVFIIGLYAGILFEEGRFEDVNEYYLQSEVSLIDVLALDNLLGTIDVSCSDLKKANRDLLDRVYEEASLLGEFEESGKLTRTLKTFHKKYDVLRTYLWINSVKVKELCNSSFSTLVYLYNHQEEDLTKKAEQNVWSKVLEEIKTERGDTVVLIPIAVDTNLISLNSFIKKYDIRSFPAVIVNEEIVFEEIVDKNEVLALLK